MTKQQAVFFIVFGLFIVGMFLYFYQPPHQATKLYWFIPDGMRAEPEMFTIYQWAEEGKLPNIKKMMDEGSYGYSVPDFPSHTPVNFASLLTGTHPITHGVADGPMHIEGFPLEKPSVKGFASTAKKVAPAWKIFEDNDKKVALLSVPGSTPPELHKGITIRGRWGGWGADLQSIIFESSAKLAQLKFIGRGTKLFFFGPELTTYVDSMPVKDWSGAPQSFSVPHEANFNSYGAHIYVYIYDSTNDGVVNYDHAAFSFDKKNYFFNSPEGKWSEWTPIKLSYMNFNFDSNIKINIIKIWPDGTFRIKVLYDGINKYIVDPDYVASMLEKAVGPMVDFPDNYPPQLIYESEDKQAFLDEAHMALDWHKNAGDYILGTLKPDIFIQDTYTSNQMLESRWWHAFIDTTNKNYSPAKAAGAWNDVLDMYKGLDAILGQMLNHADKNTLVVLSSDHGVCPLHRLVNLNNYFAQKGWLKFSIDPKTGNTIIDWPHTKVVYLKMAYIYVNPNGLGGNWHRGSGKEYENLRNEIISSLYQLKDSDGAKPVVNAVKWENAPQFFELPTDRIGDIVLEAKPTYFWGEETSNDLQVFVDPITSGYKQSIDPKTLCMRTPFMIMGPGVKKNHFIKDPISHINQLPTFLRLMHIEEPKYITGKAVKEIFISP